MLGRKLLLVLLLAGLASSAFAQLDSLHVLWDRSGQTDSSAYGYKILPLGDQNNDGYADWAVYAQGNSFRTGYHGTRASYLEFFHGGNPPAAEPYFTYRIDSALYDPYWYVQLLGDLNGDGYPDWMITAIPRGTTTYYDYLFFYGGTANDSVPGFVWRMVAGSGIYDTPNFDFNGDGIDDLYAESTSLHSIVVYYGGAPLDTFPDVILHPLSHVPYALGDFNGDGSSDFVCYNPNPPYNMAVFLGGANPDTVPAYSWTNMPWPIGGVKSINGDNADEFLLNLGVYLGRDSLRNTPDFVLHSSCGNQAVSAGDVNRDGYNDLILLTPTTPDNMFGCFDLHLGHPWLYPDPVITIEGNWPDGLIGIYAAAGLGDVNGDHVDDFAIGAWDDFAYLGWRGRCVILSGDTNLVADAPEQRAELPQELDVRVFPNPFNSETRITFNVSTPGAVDLAIFNINGQRVRTLAQERYSIGEHSVAWDGRTEAGLAAGAGVYFCSLRAGQQASTQKLLLLK